MKCSACALALCVLISARFASGDSDAVIGRAVRAASLVVEAESSRLLRPSSRAQMKVITSIKGTPASGQLDVDLQKAPVGLWPRLGERRILCLARRAADGVYELASYSGSILEPKEDVRLAIARVLSAPVLAEPAAVQPSPTAEEPVSPATPAASPLAQQVAASETVLVGMLSNVRLDPSGAVGTFKVESGLVGYSAYGEPVSVYFPAASGTPEPGRYALFLNGRQMGDGFDVVSAKWGAVRLADEEQEKKLQSEVAAALPPGGARKFTTIQAMLAEWQDSWNKRELERCIRCYASGNPLRRQYETGGEGKARLKEQIESFPGTIGISVQKVQITRSAGGARGAEVTVLLTISADGVEDRRTATMKLVCEDGEWLILEEGF